jgi:hypothetical protein
VGQQGVLLLEEEQFGKQIFLQKKVSTKNAKAIRYMLYSFRGMGVDIRITPKAWVRSLGIRAAQPL